MTAASDADRAKAAEPVTLAAGYARGNRIVTYDGRTWVYADGSQFDESRPCTKCGAVIPDVDLPDTCLAWLPGVAFACCGHGVPGEEYVKTEDGVLYGSVAAWRAAQDGQTTGAQTCPTCGHSTAPIWFGQPGSGDHSEDDGSCFACGPELGRRCAMDEVSR